jgi:hypothetical protein
MLQNEEMRNHPAFPSSDNKSALAGTYLQDRISLGWQVSAQEAAEQRKSEYLEQPEY